MLRVRPMDGTKRERRRQQQQQQREPVKFGRASMQRNGRTDATRVGREPVV